MNNIYKKTDDILKKNNQEHIISIMNNLSEEKKAAIAQQILDLDFKEIKKLYASTQKSKDIVIDKIDRIDPINPEKLTEAEIQEYLKIGKKAIRSKKLAVTIMAGGQGTRLGHDGPKGTFKLDIGENGKYLFEIVIDKLRRAKKKYGIYIPCYIMTSEENNAATKKFFELMNYFGYPKKYIRFFTQSSTLVLSEEGKLVIGENYLIQTSSSGNGEIFKSMKEQGILKEMKKQGTEWVLIGSIDNILLHLVDSLLLGIAIKGDKDIAARTVQKTNPEENVGVYCKQDGKVRIIEYTEMPKELAEKKAENGELFLCETNIACNLFSVNALEKASEQSLGFHLAHKKVTFLDENGILVRPDKPNCYKFERFMFDVFPSFNDIAILRGNRQTDFAPIKNAEGEDSPETAKKLYLEYIKNIENKYKRRNQNGK